MNIDKSRYHLLIVGGSVFLHVVLSFLHLSDYNDHHSECVIES